jgi:hypothetical protein
MAVTSKITQAPAKIKWKDKGKEAELVTAGNELPADMMALRSSYKDNKKDPLFFYRYTYFEGKDQDKIGTFVPLKLSDINKSLSFGSISID